MGNSCLIRVPLFIVLFTNCPGLNFNVCIHSNTITREITDVKMSCMEVVQTPKILYQCIHHHMTFSGGSLLPHKTKNIMSAVPPMNRRAILVVNAREIFLSRLFLFDPNQYTNPTNSEKVKNVAEYTIQYSLAR